VPACRAGSDPTTFTPARRDDADFRSGRLGIGPYQKVSSYFYAGRPHPEKELDVLFGASSTPRYATFVLIIAGDRPRRARGSRVNAATRPARPTSGHRLAHEVATGVCSADSLRHPWAARDRSAWPRASDAGVPSGGRRREPADRLIVPLEEAEWMAKARTQRNLAFAIRTLAAWVNPEARRSRDPTAWPRTRFAGRVLRRYIDTSAN